MFSSQLQNLIIVRVCMQVFSYMNILLLNIVLLLLRPDLKLVVRNYLTLTINIDSVIFVILPATQLLQRLLSSVQSGVVPLAS